MKRRGFTLIELLVVVAIIAVMLSTAALSVGSGTASVRMKNAVRSVWHLSGYARMGERFILRLKRECMFLGREGIARRDEASWHTNGAVREFSHAPCSSFTQ